MEAINTELIGKIATLNEKVLKFTEQNVFKDTGITLGQYNILSELIENDLTTINELKSNLLISAPALSQILGRMELNGLISREINKNNKRETSVVISKKAKQIFEEVTKKYLAVTEEKLKNISDSEKKEIISLLENLENKCL